MEGHTFLTDFLKKTKSEESEKDITPFEVARFRLLSSTISKTGNQVLFLGVHDANIIFASRHIKLGLPEISRLIDCGLKNIKNENAPLWHWYNNYNGDIGDDYFAFKSFSSAGEDEGVSIGALEAMTLIGSELFPKWQKVDRNVFIEKWLSDDHSDNLKNAALRYLKHHGRISDIPLIQSEVDRSNSKTTKTSLEATLSIQLRNNKEEAHRTLVANQFASIDRNIVQDIMSASLVSDKELLVEGLKHRNRAIRLESFRGLVKTNQIDNGMLQGVKNDSCDLVRNELVIYLLSKGKLMSDEEVKGILVQPRKDSKIGGLLSAAYPRKGGEDFLNEYLFSKYTGMPEGELLELVKEDALLNDIPYFALCSRYGTNHTDQLRKNVDDRFKDYFDKHLLRLKGKGFPSETIGKIRSLEDFLRKKLTSRGFELLCKRGKSKDLKRIRKNMRSGYMKSSVSEIEYMRKRGEWEDISFLLKAERDYTTRTTLIVPPNDYKWSRAIAEAIYNIGRERLEELLKVEMPSHILVEFIRVCSFARFSKISDKVVLSTLNHKEDKVRKITALKCVQSHKKSTLKALLEKYVDGQEYQYYNVLFWLDLGVSMPKSITTKATRFIINEL